MASGPTEADPIRAAGAVLWRPGPHGAEVALIHRPRYDDWTLPKGKLKGGEHVLAAAVREVTEETGIRPVLGRRLAAQHYLKEGRPKQVEWWTATPADSGPFQPNDEVDQLAWLPAAEAEQRLSYERDLPVLRGLVEGPLPTTPLILMRHASAGEKSEWTDDDTLRPLDPDGRPDAALLGTLLAAYGTARVICSATARCVETVLPYLQRTGAELRTDLAYTADPGGRRLGDPETVAKRTAELLAEQRPTILCTHGELVPEIITQVCEHLGAAAPEEPNLRKASFWAVHMADSRLAAIERHAIRG
ncbi:NUDIX domain-containing protein [Allonocardiopsis opalescens]|uniref:8-oxo-dGTP diphosphatase n=1 Tax=Allonocardiopsis opalescens TaxID=1144618 RepID=A0A2T0Q9J9_9ACTN|nr:NUDIX domain-containing protein [Allonocardiopsis opalescens]PRY00517.1 8-oxo-dGTP diphosphatase [Allonocardiopsis opalescens]